jgi:hypothetical protein
MILIPQQGFFTELPPVWVRTIIAGVMSKKFREEYFQGTSHNNNFGIKQQ